MNYNKDQVVTMARQLESRSIREGLLDSYNSEFRKYVDRGTFVEIGDEERRDYKGPVQLISHHGVLSGSATTPLRIVNNTSLKNGSLSLNDCLPKGPNSLNSIFDIGVRFLSFEKGVVFDLC